MTSFTCPMSAFRAEGRSIELFDIVQVGGSGPLRGHGSTRSCCGCSVAGSLWRVQLQGAADQTKKPGLGSRAAGRRHLLEVRDRVPERALDFSVESLFAHEGPLLEWTRGLGEHFLIAIVSLHSLA